MVLMERLESANFLGVSLSTLDRLASQGRLKKGRAKRKTRPVTVYDRKELESLKAELEAIKPGRAKRQGLERQLDTVGFRIDPLYIKRLQLEGETRGMSVGEYARFLVIRSLEDTTSQRVAEELTALRKSLSGMFYLILVDQFEASPEEAQAIVTKLGG